MKRKFRLTLLILIGLLGVLGTFQPAAAQTEPGQGLALVLNAEGPLTPVMVSYIERSLDIARQACLTE